MKIVVFDDDPTGSQTVYGCPLLLQADVETIRKGLQDSSPLLFLLINTRAMLDDMVEHTIRNVSKHLKRACELEGYLAEDLLIISRGDSTLRGHGVLEPRIISRELGPFDATFHIPAFFEGKRTTRNGMHFLDDKPVHESEFAKDRIFGYSTSYLPNWLEEKSHGLIKSKNVVLLGLKLLDQAIDNQDGFNLLLRFLKNLSDNQNVVVDAESVSHLLVFSMAVKKLNNQKRFLYRSAASLINALVDLPQNPANISDLASLRLQDRDGNYLPGLVLVGSYVPIADQQLEILFQDKSCLGIEIAVQEIASIFEANCNGDSILQLKSKYLALSKQVIRKRKTPVIYTTRSEVLFSDSNQRVLFGIYLARFMADLVAELIPELGYIISKGGITTNILLSNGLGLKSVSLKGQIMPGLSMVCPDNVSVYGSIPIITFPGNLGNQNSLMLARKIMESNSSHLFND